MMCQRIGLPPISTIGLGRTALSSLMRVPNPPARMTAYMDEPGVEVIHDGGNRVIDRQPPSVSGCAECRADGKFVALIHSTFRSLGLPALEETMLTLYTYFRSSAAFRVRIALNLKGLQWQPEV